MSKALKTLTEIKAYCEQKNQKILEGIEQSPEYLAYDKALIQAYKDVIAFTDRLRIELEDTSHLD